MSTVSRISAESDAVPTPQAARLDMWRYLQHEHPEHLGTYFHLLRDLQDPRIIEEMARKDYAVDRDGRRIQHGR